MNSKYVCLKKFIGVLKGMELIVFRVWRNINKSNAGVVHMIDAIMIKGVFPIFLGIPSNFPTKVNR